MNLFNQPLNRTAVREKTFQILGAVWVFYYLAVLLKTGYISDDTFNSQVAGEVIIANSTIWERTIAQCRWWMETPGRFMPLAFYSYPLFYYLRSLFAYKVITILMSVLCVGLMAKLVAMVSRSRAMGLLTFFVLPVFFQFRAWHDPFLAFAFLLPLSTAHLLLSLIFFQKYLARSSEKPRSVWLLGASLFFHLCALLTYEVTYLGIGAFIILAYQQKGHLKQSIKASVPQFIAWGIVVMITLALKTPLNPHYINEHAGASLSLNFGKIIRAFSIQAYSAFPLSYYWKVKTHVRQYIDNWDLLVIVGIFLATFLLFRAVIIQAQKTLRFMLLLGAYLAFAPAMIMGLSGYQDILIEAGFGMGYIAVYPQYFGLFLLLTGALIWLSQKMSTQKLKNALFFTAAVAVAATAFYNLGQNRSVALEANKTYFYPRKVIDGAFNRGMLENLPKDLIVLRRYVYPHDHTWNYAKFANRPVPLEEPEAFFAKPEAYAKVVAGQVYVVSYSFDLNQGSTGTFHMGRVRTFQFNANSKRMESLGVDQLRIYDLKSDEITSVQIPEGKLVEFKDYAERAYVPPLTTAEFKVESRFITLPESPGQRLEKK